VSSEGTGGRTIGRAWRSENRGRGEPQTTELLKSEPRKEEQSRHLGEEAERLEARELRA